MHVIAKTALISQMTGGTPRIRSHQQSISIAVRTDLLDLERVARRFAFLPQPTFSATEEHHTPARHGRVQRLSAHVAEHQYCTTVRVLDHCWNEATALIKIETSPPASPLMGGRVYE